MKVLITGMAGFIGHALAQLLVGRGDTIVGIDNLNSYYDVNLKLDRLTNLGVDRAEVGSSVRAVSKTCNRLSFERMDIVDKERIDSLFATERFDVVVHLAGQAGVRYSISHPYDYLRSNVEGFLNVLEACRYYPVKHLVYASSSSVYGKNWEVPYKETDSIARPVSLYAAFKKSNELMAYAYSNLYGTPTTGLRFFTVYGPWGRPDMSPILFANAISEGSELRVFNHGDLLRDFTYIDDITAGIVSVIDCPPTEQECNSKVLAKVYNIGCGHTVKLTDFISELEQLMGKEAHKVMLPMQAGDVYETFADTSLLQRERGFKPRVQLHEGLSHFVAWYKDYKVRATQRV